MNQFEEETLIEVNTNDKLLKLLETLMLLYVMFQFEAVIVIDPVKYSP